MNEEIVTLPTSDGSLTAILHRAENSAATERSPNSCVILVSSGQTPSFGPQRFYLKAARAWAARGLDVLRVDLAGMGDAVAENREIHIDCHRTSDVRVAVDYARHALHCDRLYLAGLCAGARVAIRYAADDSKINGLVSWNCPIHTVRFGAPSSDAKASRAMSDSRARDNLRRLGKAIASLDFLSPTWWRWVLSHAGAFSREMLASLVHVIRPRTPDVAPFVDALAHYVASNRPALYMYGSVERIAIDEFEESFPGQELQIVSDGTHTFATLESEAVAIRDTGDWLLHGGRSSAP